MVVPTRSTPRRRSIQPIRQPYLEFIEHRVLRGGFQALMPEGLLRLANVALGEFRPHAALEVVRLHR